MDLRGAGALKHRCTAVDQDVVRHVTASVITLHDRFTRGASCQLCSSSCTLQVWLKAVAGGFFDHLCQTYDAIRPGLSLMLAGSDNEELKAQSRQLQQASGILQP